MDSITMKWMERLTCKDTAKQIDEMIIKEYVKEWKSKMYENNILWLIPEVYKILHQHDRTPKENLVNKHLMRRKYMTGKGVHILSFNSLNQVLLNYYPIQK